VGAHLDRAGVLLGWVESGRHVREGAGGRRAAELALLEAIATYEAAMSLLPRELDGRPSPHYVHWRNLGSAYAQLRWITGETDLESESARLMRRAYGRYLRGLEEAGMDRDPALRANLEAILERRSPF